MRRIAGSTDKTGMDMRKAYEPLPALAINKRWLGTYWEEPEARCLSFFSCSKILSLCSVDRMEPSG